MHFNRKQLTAKLVHACVDISMLVVDHVRCTTVIMIRICSTMS